MNEIIWELIAEILFIAFLWGLLYAILKNDLEDQISPLLNLIVIAIVIGLVLIIKQPLLIFQPCLFFICLLFVSVYDLETKSIPRFIHLPFLFIGFFNVLGAKETLLDVSLGMFLLPLPMLLIYWVKKGEGIGLGDILLVGSTGFVLGLTAGFVGLLTSLICGVVYCLINKQTESIALAPFISAGAFAFYCVNYFISNNILQ